MTIPDVIRAGAGGAMFARYAYPPNELGYCGPGDGRDLLDYAAGSGNRLDVDERARAFDGAWPYLEFIARSLGCDSALDPRVVEAYWLGNDLLDAVDPAEFKTSVRTAFGSQLGADWSVLDPSGPRAPLPNHSFHVFAIYPWVGVLRRTGAAQALEVLDRCRIRWGRVTSIEGDEVLVESQPLTWDGTTLALGPAVLERVRRVAHGRSLAGSVHPGEWVSMHWDWVCESLASEQLTALRVQTDRQLALTNGRT